MYLGCIKIALINVYFFHSLFKIFTAQVLFINYCWYMFWKTQRWMRSQFMWHKSPFDSETISFTATYQICRRPEGEKCRCSSCFPVGWNLGHVKHVLCLPFATLETLDWQSPCFSGHTHHLCIWILFPLSDSKRHTAPGYLKAEKITTWETLL